MLIEYAGGDPYKTVLTATDEEVLATWIDGRAVLVSEQLDEALGADDCVALDGTAPRVRGVLGAFRLSVWRFGEYLENVVPLNDTTRQAACEPPRPGSP